ncbi:clumping factor A isoform X3 [Polyergus mexicanus]|uniref:clumping factor A isoform X3 n=1 Tax=Polyergus mexicanus TaxID=615972 RepID=UPI0038B5ACF3
MTMECKSSSTATIKNTSENDGICPELRLLQSIAVQTSLGQTALKLVDSFLWTVEKCAEWSLPAQEVEDENGKSEFVRPLPWILFLPSLVMLRTMRMTMNVGAFIIGYPLVTPRALVKFLQKSRTRLNDIKNSETREKEDKATTTSEEKSVTESTDNTEKQRNLISHSESEEMNDKDEDEETLEEKINRLALESSDEDEDFDPANCTVSSNESRDNSNEDGDSEIDEDDGNVSSAELCDLIEGSKRVMRDAKTEVENEIEKLQAAERAASQVFDQRLPAGESRDKVEERLSQRIDSPTCYTPDKSSEGDSIFYSPISSDNDMPKAPITEKCVSRNSLKTNEYANGDTHFITASMISETSKTFRGDNNGAVEKRSANVSKCHKGKRTNYGNRRKK